MVHRSTDSPIGSRPVARQYFGTDGVRGIVGEFITVDLVEKLGKASALWSGGGRVFVGRDTRGSGEELEEAFARGVVSAGGAAVLAGVVPTPAVALLRLDLGVVISASHNPPEYNGVKFFDRTGRKLTDAAEEEIDQARGQEGAAPLVSQRPGPIALQSPLIDVRRRQPLPLHRLHRESPELVDHTDRLCATHRSSPSSRVRTGTARTIAL